MNRARPSNTDKHEWRRQVSVLLDKLRQNSSGGDHESKVLGKVAQEKPGIAVLIEMPAKSCRADLLSGYWVVQHEEIDPSQNVLILVRKDWSVGFLFLRCFTDLVL